MSPGAVPFRYAGLHAEELVAHPPADVLRPGLLRNNKLGPVHANVEHVAGMDAAAAANAPLPTGARRNDTVAENTAPERVAANEHVLPHVQRVRDPSA